MASPRKPSRGEAAPPSDFADLTPAAPTFIDLDTRQAIYDVDRKVEVVANDVGHVEKRLERIETAIEKLGDKLRDEFKEFRKEEFKPIADAVTKLKIRWGYAAGVAAVVTFILTFALEWAKKQLGF